MPCFDGDGIHGKYGDVRCILFSAQKMKSMKLIHRQTPRHELQTAVARPAVVIFAVLREGAGE
jgi:hypothetical protein